MPCHYIFCLGSVFLSLGHVLWMRCGQIKALNFCCLTDSCSHLLFRFSFTSCCAWNCSRGTGSASLFAFMTPAHKRSGVHKTGKTNTHTHTFTYARVCLSPSKSFSCAAHNSVCLHCIADAVRKESPASLFPLVAQSDDDVTEEPGAAGHRGK